MKTFYLLFLFLLTLGSFSVFTTAQDEEDDEPEDLKTRIQYTEREQQQLRGRLKLTDERLALLNELQKLERSIEPIEDELEKTTDDDRREELEEKLESIEVAIHEVEVKLEINEQRGGLLETIHDLDGEGQRAIRQEAALQIKMLDAAANLVEKLSQAIRDGEEEEIEELEAEFGEMEEFFERRREILQLKVDLHYAREEQDEAAIRKLQRELKEILKKDGEPENEPNERADRPRNLPAPISFTQAELAEAAKLDFEKQIVPLLKEACFECHSGASSSGDLDLGRLVRVKPLVVNRSHWVNVIQQLKVRSMPPTKEAQPTEANRRRMAAGLTDAINNFDYETVRQPGYEPARRLTHDEYNNTVRDLTGFDIRPADRFPNDLTASSGFENSANSLFIQPVTLERYVGAAEAIVEAAWPAKPKTAAHRRAWQRLLGEGVSLGEISLNDTKTIQAILSRFATRAFRRPVEADELASLLRHFESRRQSVRSAKNALREVLQVVLVSSSFLIRSEQDASEAGKPFPVSDWELASRLSYFLWASMPDDELFRLAKVGQLRKPTVIASQIDRMLADNRAGTLGRLFAAQWLGFADMDRVQRDQIDNPWATDSLVEAMKEESALLFNSLVEANSPIDRLVDADYTFLNEELARHYQMKGVAGSQMRKVSMSRSPRRGILGHGSILAVTSFPGRTSPVLRGNRILARLLGTPPPPPPPNVSEFDDRIAENRRLSQRQKLEMHRSNPNCYPCHSQIDPLGFALEEFEWFGRYRPVQRGKRIDAKGTLPGSREFTGLAGLSKALLTERTGDLVDQLTRKMLSYALGRQLEYYDEATVADLKRQLQSNDRRLRSLIVAIVQSNAFQQKQLPSR